MTNVLIIDSAATGDKSVSRKLTTEFEAQLRARDPQVRIVHRDVGRQLIPHLTEDTVSAIRGAPETDAGRVTQALSDELIAELQAADLIVIGAPMYNFGMTSTLKAWFDHVLRAGITFRYTAEGPEGLVTASAPSWWKRGQGCTAKVRQASWTIRSRISGRCSVSWASRT
jgi:FMN-dependent NADH-azoreductase